MHATAQNRLIHATAEKQTRFHTAHSREQRFLLHILLHKAHSMSCNLLCHLQLASPRFPPFFLPFLFSFSLNVLIIISLQKAAPASSAPTPTAPAAPLCNMCHKKPRRTADEFCSEKCAAAHAERELDAMLGGGQPTKAASGPPTPPRVTSSKPQARKGPPAPAPRPILSVRKRCEAVRNRATLLWRRSFWFFSFLLVLFLLFTFAFFVSFGGFLSVWCLGCPSLVTHFYFISVICRQSVLRWKSGWQATPTRRRTLAARAWQPKLKVLSLTTPVER